MKTESRLRGLFALSFLLSFFAFLTLNAFLVLVHPKLPASANVSDEHLDIVFYPQSNYLHPGEVSTFYFEIINKESRIANRMDINLKVVYYGNIVYERSESSIRDYKQGEKVVITTERQLPLTTPPGEYVMRFQFKPDNINQNYTAQLNYKIYVQPSFYQLLFSFLGVLIFGYSFLYFKKVEISVNSLISLLRKEYKHFTVGQRFLFLGICAIIMTALFLMLGAESLANQVAIVAYYLLTIGVANNLLEYLKIEKEEVRYVLSLYVLFALVFLPDNGIEDLIGKTLSAFTLAWAGFSFLDLEKKCRNRVVKYLAILLVLWIIYNLLKNSMPYYSIGLLIALLLYLRNR